MTDAPIRNPRGSALPGYDQAYDRYARWVAGSSQSKLIQSWIITILIAAALVTVAQILPVGGDYAKAALCIPAAVAIFVTLLGISHWRLLSSDEAVPLRTRYTPRQRRRISLITGAVVIVAFAAFSHALPFAFGGTAMMVFLFSIMNFLSLTSDERYREREGVLDPREYTDEEVDEPLPDVLEEDFTWDDVDEPEGNI